MKKSWLCLQPQLCTTEKTEKIVTGETFESAKIVWCDFVDHLLNLILALWKLKFKCKTKTNYSGQRNYELYWEATKRNQ